MLKAMLNKEDYRKVMLIKKYAKIRFRNFWNEWGITKFEAECFGAVSLIFFTLFICSLF